MKGWLLDTNILSQFAPDKSGRVRVDPRLAEWLRARSDSLYISAVSVAEVTRGIAGLRRSGASERADGLQVWIDRILALYEDRALPVDVSIGRTAGRIDDRARSIGRHPGFADTLIAATAETHRLTLLTQNLRHFAPLGLSIAVVDPLVSDLQA
ncbi:MULTISPECIES: type II toxin-antitoxin system VapC family toxin [unclassified Aureimonas]|uniref:type II toxin-antitoxin system VapC family toxin n=1 Tax=unclassified Aureimonas TaxID=2615206 RepID=UPI0006F958DB|nr:MULTISPECIES: type II toxin-antitoxin system VapC family toxin [unclassified Aureimonas]KQT64134.1 hypothetical protein ASG62_03795 [Aureimonas sp. Leaf427]KQT81323.1 hypothetical protein ASG54_01065 [Aureimonas sp. Leaf460]